MTWRWIVDDGVEPGPGAREELEAAAALVPESVAVHKTKTPHKPQEGGKRFYYAVRNGIYIFRGDTLSTKEKVGWTFVVGEQIRQFLLIERFRPWALLVVARGVRDGLFTPRP